MKNPFAEYFRLIRKIQQARREGRTDELIRAAKENAGLQKVMMQPKRYETINGSGEIGWGAAMLCFVFSSYAFIVLPASPWRGWIGMGFLVCVCVVMPLSLWASRKFVTWPRVGYVAFRRDKAWWVGIVVSMVVAAAVSIGLVYLMRPEIIHQAQAQAHHAATASPVPAGPGTMSRSLRFVLVGTALTNALLYLMINAVSIREHRWKWLLLALLATVPPAIGCFVPGNFNEVWRPMTLFLGVIWFGSGAATLIWFLRHHPLPAPDAA